MGSGHAVTSIPEQCGWKFPSEKFDTAIEREKDEPYKRLLRCWRRDVWSGTLVVDWTSAVLNVNTYIDGMG
jgi:hypothetical protein